MRLAVVLLLAWSTTTHAASLRPFASMRDLAMRPISAQGISAPASPIFTATFNDADPANLPSTLGATGATLVFRCDSRDISAGVWTCSSDAGSFTLSEAGAGSSPTSGSKFHPFTDSASRAVSFLGGKYFDGTLPAAITLTDDDDFIVEVAYQRTSGVAFPIGLRKADGTRYLSHYVDAGASNWAIKGASSDALQGASNVTVPLGSWIYEMIAGQSDSGTSACVSNGADCTVAGAFGAMGDVYLDTVRLGASVVAGYTEPGVSAIASLWHCNGGCLASSAATVAIGQDRFARLTGTRPSVAVDSVPTFTRASTAMTDADLDDDGVRRLALTGAAWPRLVKRNDDGSTIREGLLFEPQVTNQEGYSEVDADWTVTALDLPLLTGQAFIDNTLLATQVTKAIGLSSAYRASVASAATIRSVFAKATGDGDIMLGVNGSWRCFDLQTCTSTAEYSGNSVATTASGADDLGNDWCRVWVEVASTTNGDEMYFLDDASSCAAADLSDPFDPILLAGVQAETGLAFPTSYIPTSGAAATRLADVLTYDAANVDVASGTIEVEVLCEDYDLASDVTLLGFGTDADNRVEIYVDSANDRASAFVRASATTTVDMQASSGDVFDGDVHTIRLTYAANDVNLYVDTTLLAADNTATMLGSATKLAVGAGVTGTGQSGCMVLSVNTYDSEVAP